jgi:hypothetical protein
LKKIFFHAAFYTTYDIELFFYKFLLKKNIFFFNKNKEHIFLLDLVYYYIQKYQFNFFQIPHNYKELLQLFYYFEEFETRSDLQKTLKNFLFTYETQDFIFELKKTILEVLETTHLINQEIFSENKRTHFFYLIQSHNNFLNASLDVTTVDDHFFKTPFYNQQTPVLRDQVLIDLEIPTTLQLKYMFPNYCYTHLICDVDLDIELEGLVWF